MDETTYAESYTEQSAEQSGFNEAKKEILGVIAELGPVTSSDIALITNRTMESASMCLLRYHKMGLLSRHTLKGRTKIYDIRTQGVERLAWLNQRESNEDAYVES